MTDLSKALGFKQESLPVAWNKRDLLLYANGIGAKVDGELRFLDELRSDFVAFPTYPVVLALRGDSQEVTDYNVMKDAGGEIPGLPKLDPTKLVHGEQSIFVTRPIPLVSGPGWRIEKEITGVHDKGGKALIVESTLTLVDPKGVDYARMVSTSFNFGKFDGQKFSKSHTVPFPIKSKSKPPSSNPIAVVREATTPEQAALYRLSGDYNALHIDPTIGPGMGFRGVILHGLCSYGFAARAIVKSVPGNFKGLSARFTAPVIPGDVLITKIWTEESQDGKGIEVHFIQEVEGGKQTLGAGVALVEKLNTSHKL